MIALATLAAVLSAGCGEREPGPYADLPGSPPPPDLLGTYRGEAGRLVVRPADDPACERLLAVAVPCYTHDEGLSLPDGAATDPIDAGPVALLGEEIVLQVGYSVDPPEASCVGLRGHHSVVPGENGSVLQLERIFLRGRPVTEPREGPCEPPEVWEPVP